MEAPKPLVPTSAHQKPADPRELAETLALGSILVSSKKARMQLIDAAYNRYAFDRDDTLPEWFQEDEDKHNQPELPITKELMKTFRDKLREINARPIRKVLEAKARKKRRLKLRLEKLRSTAMTLSENGEMSDIAKARHMRQAVSAMARQEQRKVSVVAIKKTGGGHKSDKGKTPKGAKTKVVDRRMKSDTRGQKKALKRNKGKVSAKIKRKMQKTHASKNRQHKNVGGTSKKQAGIYGKSTA
jgi:AdoMet-dependent rRNA methyltransferase SPB1